MEVKVKLQGSGFAIDPLGYIVTNGHVLFSFTDKDVQNDQVAAEFIIEKAVDEFVNSSGIDRKYALAHVKMITSPRRERITVQLGKAFVGAERNAKPHNASIIGNPSPATEKDIAIVKIDARELEFLELREPAIVSEGEEVLIAGYSEAVLGQKLLAPEQGFEPSTIKAMVGTKRTTIGGLNCFEIGADLAPGQSGGPAVDMQGRVVGFVTFGSSGREGKIHGFSFLGESNVLKEFMVETGVWSWKIIRTNAEVVTKLKTLLDVAFSHGEFVMKNCAYSEKGFCTLWEWGRKPSLPTIDGSLIDSTPSDGGYHMQVNYVFCAMCPHFVQRIRLPKF
jgi:hypothetical protein